ncbi:YdcF family protein [Anaerocolumna aminovalerica]|jgi:uncharacterized SAM-binding protein YcdF (DUF218 family)|uniref:YdcF family protein n=1 Tax=Anaerocolumna aminovalerica TaxID=1527 RepID=UPI000BE29389|nr:YdcF family protein [Anaerocolumna aminovalerica]
MNLLTISLLGMGILCILYFVVIILYAGPKASFLQFWIVTGMLLILAAFLYPLIETDTIATLKYIKHAAGILLFFGAIIFIVTEIRILSSGSKKVSLSAEYVIVLGAQVKGKVLSKTLKSRMDTACKYLKGNKDAKVIVSGGQGDGEDISEAEAMSNYLVKQGIEPYRIIKEDQSVNTYENIKYSKKFLKEETALVILITSSFHVYRAMGIAKRQGLKVQGLGAPSDQVLVLNYYIREFFAVVKDRLIGNI